MKSQSHTTENKDSRHKKDKDGGKSNEQETRTVRNSRGRVR